ncbi:hypothetical protein ABPG72_020304 [Tetrahymena utriculariae]
MSTVENKVEQQVVTEQQPNTTEQPVQQAQEGAEGQQQQQQQQQQPKKYKYLKCNYKYCKHYEDINQIVKSFKHLQSLQVELKVDEIPNALCYVIRSNNDDDVHKAIKYGIWTSVPGNNVKLNAAWEKAQELNVDVYLFFSVVKSGQFIGVAKLKSSFQEETFSYWWQPHKFKGHFKIEWVFVKDVKQKAFEGLKNIVNDDISRSKDCTELNFEATGKKMLQIFKDTNSSTSIFKDFVYFDQQEQVIRNSINYFGRQNNKGNYQQRNNNQNQAQFQNFFPQMMAQGVFPQYTQEQLQQISQMCFTNIYPPNTYPAYNAPFLMGNNLGSGHGKYHNNNNKRNYNNKKNNNHQNKEKPQHHQNTHQQQPQQQPQQAEKKN